MRQSVLCASLVIAGLASQALAADERRPRGEGGSLEVPKIVATRCGKNPLIVAGGAETGSSVNGPSVIRTPPWLPRPLGRYYLYFAHHHGEHIRLAYADELCGPWRVYAPGTLRLDQAPRFAGHIASPDVHVDAEHREIRMYFHGPRAGDPRNQRTGVAASPDGVHFEVLASDLGPSYFRVWRDGPTLLALARGPRGGALLRSDDDGASFAPGPDVLPGMRHAAVLPWRGGALVFFSRIGDAPERILATRLVIAEGGPPRVTEPVEVLRPEAPYEGVDLPISSSRSGATGPAHQLRDPAVLEEDGRVYLFYAIRGEQGIGVAELEIGEPEG